MDAADRADSADSVDGAGGAGGAVRLRAALRPRQGGLRVRAAEEGAQVGSRADWVTQHHGRHDAQHPPRPRDAVHDADAHRQRALRRRRGGGGFRSGRRSAA